MLCGFNNIIYKTENILRAFEGTLLHTREFWKRSGFKWEDIINEGDAFHYNNGNDRKMENYYDCIKFISPHNVNDYNYKDQLLRYYHSINWKHPQYVLLKEDGIGNKKMFTMGVLDNDNNIIFQARDNSKRKAEQKVSKYVLYKYGKLSREQLKDVELDLLNI